MKIYLFCISDMNYKMQLPLKIATVSFNSDDSNDRIFDMTGKCAFAICTKGEFCIKILNEQYVVKEHCMFACMPFVNINVIKVVKPSEVVFGYLQLDDIPRMINTWVNTNNLSAIQNNPLVEITDARFDRMIDMINGYISECENNMDGSNECRQIQHDIIDLHSRLIVAQVVKIYFTNISMAVSGHTYRDVLFQRFMLDLYANCREQRKVRFYAMRSGLSLKYFSTIVRQLSGASPSEWIETVVVGEAKSMLNDIHRNIKDIATQLNFPDAPTFTKYFLRVTGMSPKAYRKSNMK